MMNERIRPVYKRKKNDRRGKGTVDSISIASIARVFFEKEVSRKLHCWTKQMENQDPPPHPPPSPPKPRTEKWRVLVFMRLHP